jgi:hypothetical protein
MKEQRKVTTESQQFIQHFLKHTEKTQQQNATQTEENQHNEVTMNCNKTKTTAQTTNNQQCQKGTTTANKMRTMTTESKNMEPKQEQRHNS